MWLSLSPYLRWRLPSKYHNAKNTRAAICCLLSVDKLSDVANTCFYPSAAAGQHIAFSFDDAHRENDDSHRNKKDEGHRSEDPVPNRHIQDYVSFPSVVPVESAVRARRAVTRHPRDVEMTARGKPGKPKAGFPSFPPPLEIASRFPHFHIFDDYYTLVQNQTTTAVQLNL